MNNNHEQKEYLIDHVIVPRYPGTKYARLLVEEGNWGAFKTEDYCYRNEVKPAVYVEWTTNDRR